MIPNIHDPNSHGNLSWILLFCFYENIYQIRFYINNFTILQYGLSQCRVKADAEKISVGISIPLRTKQEQTSLQTIKTDSSNSTSIDRHRCNEISSDFVLIQSRTHWLMSLGV
ncbi:hypothetical protein L1987_05172 [Smallanthus sonchifolius]|uniref:Uncharacterized protein n=1 Tax=Smallanthus sonchifolius TaxID=185202 RepID=A0ACB9JUQ4_9ASTR|nr:hypothetical protein L1987_05172 [Smallanthus sonchifolius]